MDDWAALGNPSWGWNDMAPYFQRQVAQTAAGLPRRQSAAIQEMTGPVQSLVPASTNGLLQPVKVSYPSYVYNQSSTVLSALAELDFSSSSQSATGVAVLPLFVDSATNHRSDARSAYLDPVLVRPNLHVVTGQMATRILTQSSPAQLDDLGHSANSSSALDPDQPSGYLASGTNHTVKWKRGWAQWRRRQATTALTSASITTPGPTSVHTEVRAVGVEFGSGPQSVRRNVSATREVILAAGVVWTPQLLKLSGIGPAAELRSLDLSTLIDLPGVGSNLQDHNLLSLTFPNRTSWYSADGLTQPVSLVPSELNASSPALGPQEAITLPSLAILQHNATAMRRDLLAQSMIQYLGPVADPDISAGYTMQAQLQLQNLQDTSRSTWELVDSENGGWAIANKRPLSRGWVKLQSPDPFHAPVVDPRYGSNPMDLTTLAKSIATVRRLFATQAFQGLNRPAQLPSSIIADASQISVFTKAHVQTGYNLAGTAAMLPRDQGGVVDPNLIVYGTQNIRVVDASVIPLLPGSHLQSVVYAIAEKAAHIIRAARVSPSSATSTTPGLSLGTLPDPLSDPPPDPQSVPRSDPSSDHRSGTSVVMLSTRSSPTMSPGLASESRLQTYGGYYSLTAS
ncbi:GMC oxidoreductase [Myriangium duriaei CBS 260.36]|uniref:GMC oxidoreductase n=1 Tax=Myriangium duriaei CBS 260.36 TaxID=1168546 RepID=A0A9P4MGR4_9PEZI|nr:GMC oxidoreductase [Myriangium duriaei CBS 260.36]